MRKFIQLFTISVVALTVFAGCNTTPEETPDEVTDTEETTKTITMGFIPSEKAAELSPKAEALAEFLEEEMDNVEVEVVIPTDYEPLIEGLRFGHLDIAYMDSGPAWLATQKADAEVVLAELKDGSPHYFAEVFVRADNEEMESLEDIVGKKIAFTSWTGSSGFIFPMGTMVDRGLMTPEGDDFADLETALSETFEQHIAAGGYEQALTLLIEGKVDVAGGGHDAPEKYLREDADKVRVLERLGKVPSHPVLARDGLDPEVQEQFVNAMMKLNEEENKQILIDLYGVEGLIETDTETHLGDFGPIFGKLTGVHEKVFNK